MEARIEISNGVFERLIAERKNYHEELEARGKEEGLCWAETAGYSELTRMFHAFVELYELAPMRFIRSVTHDVEYEEYWQYAFKRHPDVAQLSHYDVPVEWGTDMNEDAAAFFGGWILAVEEYYLKLKSRLEEYDNRNDLA